MAGNLTSDPQPFNPAGFKISDILSIGSLFGSTDKGMKTAQAVNSGVDALGSGAMQFIAGANMGADNYQKKLNRADAGVSALSTAVGFIPGIGTGLSAGITGTNYLGGLMMKKAKGLDLGETLGSASGYTGTAQDIVKQKGDIDAFNKAGLMGKLFGNRGGLNRETDKLIKQQTAASDILLGSQKRARGIAGEASNIAGRNMMLYSGIKGDEIKVGQKGMSIIEKKTGVPKSTLKMIVCIGKDTPKMEDGGKINVIANGKLHSQKHDLKDTVPELQNANITEKGIPVISNNSEISQHAEIERDELILHLDLTKKLEELKKKGDEEAMIEAGKILSKEIVKNTRDSKSKIIKNA